MLTDGIITLRAPEPDDVDNIFRWENDTEQWISASTTAPLSRHQVWEYVQNYDADAIRAGQLRMMIDTTEGTTIGTIDITEIDATNRRGFVGIYISEAMRSKNYGSAALTLLCQYARQTLGLHQLAAVTIADNEASRTLFRACGFRPAGRLRSWVRSGGRYLDALLWQMLFPVD